MKRYFRMLIIIGLLGLLGFVQRLPLYAEETLVPSAGYDAAMTRGVAAFNTRAYPHAVEMFEAVLSVRPDDPRAVYLLGLAEVKAGRYQDAERDLKRALDLYTEHDAIDLALSEAYLKQEKYAQARDALNKITGMPSPLVPYYKGLAAQGLGEHQQAVTFLSSAVAAAKEQNLDWLEAAQYHLGLSQQREKQYQQAGESFSEVIRQTPETYRGQEAEKRFQIVQKEQISEQEKKRVSIWGATVSTGLQYDSNVILEPSAPVLKSTLKQKRDNRFLAQVDFDYKPYPSSFWGGGYTFYQTLHLHSALHDFNVHSHEPTLFFKYDRNRLQARLDYRFVYTEVGEAPYVKNHVLQPSLTIVHHPTRSTQLFYRWDRHTYKGINFFPDNAERSGTNHALGMTEHLYFRQGRRALQLGYVVDNEDSSSDWEAIGHRFFAEAEADFGSRMQGLVNVDYTRRDYPHRNSFVTPPEERDDRILTLSGRLSRALSEVLELSAQYTFVHHDSNLSIFNYRRSIYSIVLSGRI